MAYLTFIFPNTYRDSVTLMKVSATLLATPGLTWANALMATATNLETLKQKGFALTLQPDPTNVIVAIQGENLQEDALKTLVHEALEPQHASDANEKGTHLTSLMDALEASPAPNLALISVPGAYAGAEALKALARGLDVMIFSDHVSLEEEKALKDYAHARGQLVMTRLRYRHH
jgi:FdrA protein